MWATQLRTVGVEAHSFNFEGLKRIDGNPVKDLNDFLSTDEKTLAAAGERLIP